MDNFWETDDVVGAEKPVDDFDRWINANAEVESGNKYESVGPSIDRGPNKGWEALGKYQIMPNLHFHKIGLDPYSRDDRERYLKEPELQETLGKKVYREFWDRAGGDPQKATAYKYGRGDDAEIPTAGGKRMPTGKEHWDLVSKAMGGSKMERTTLGAFKQADNFWEMDDVVEDGVQEPVAEEQAGPMETPPDPFKPLPEPGYKGSPAASTGIAEKEIIDPREPVGGVREPKLVASEGAEKPQKTIDKISSGLGSFVLRMGGAAASTPAKLGRIKRAVDKKELDNKTSLYNKLLQKSPEERNYLQNKFVESFEKEAKELQKKLLADKKIIDGLNNIADKVRGIIPEKAKEELHEDINFATSGSVKEIAERAVKNPKKYADAQAALFSSEGPQLALAATGVGLPLIAMAEMDDMGQQLDGAAKDAKIDIDDDLHVMSSLAYGLLSTGSERFSAKLTMFPGGSALKKGFDKTAGRLFKGVAGKVISGLFGIASAPVVEGLQEVSQKQMQEIMAILTLGEQVKRIQDANPEAADKLMTHIRSNLESMKDLDKNFQTFLMAAMVSGPISTMSGGISTATDVSMEKTRTRFAEQVGYDLKAARKKGLSDEKIDSEIRDIAKKAESDFYSDDDVVDAKDMSEEERQEMYAILDREKARQKKMGQELKATSEKLKTTLEGDVEAAPTTEETVPVEVVEKTKKEYEEVTGEKITDEKAAELAKKYEKPVKAEEKSTKPAEAKPAEKPAPTKETVKKPEEPVAKKPGDQPSEAQAKAGNYPMKHVKRDGMDISIETPQGTMRSGKDRTGKEWSQKMHQDYGYIKGTKGYDKDHLDVFINPKSKSDETVYVVNQVDPKTGKFDEHKVMMGFESEQAAEKAYLSNYEKGWKGLKSVVPMDIAEFKEWSKSDGPKKGELLADEERSMDEILAFSIDPKTGKKVYHGSPHKFDKFDIKKIGTGEGAQAFGHGLYFTDDKKIARGYSNLGDNSAIKGRADKTLNEKEWRAIAKNTEIGKEYSGDVKKLKELIFNEYGAWAGINSSDEITKNMVRDYAREFFGTDKKAKEDLKKAGINLEDSKNLYTATLPEGDYLKWDEPLSKEQLDKIAKEAKKEGLDIGSANAAKERDRILEDYGGIRNVLMKVSKSDKKAIKDRAKMEELAKRAGIFRSGIGGDLYRNLVDKFSAILKIQPSPKYASDFLNRAGIKGIDYPAGTLSGVEGSKARNYVVFSDEDIGIDEVVSFSMESKETTQPKLIKNITKNILKKVSPELQKNIRLHTGEFFKYYNPKQKRYSIIRFTDKQEACVWTDKRTGETHVYINSKKMKKVSTKRLSHILVHEIMGHYGANAVVASNAKLKNTVDKLFAADQDSEFMTDIDRRWKQEFDRSPDTEKREEKRKSEWIAERMAQHVNGTATTKRDQGIAKRVYEAVRRLLVDTFKIDTGRVDDVMRQMVKEMKTVKPAETGQWFSKTKSESKQVSSVAKTVLLDPKSVASQFAHGKESVIKEIEEVSNYKGKPINASILRNEKGKLRVILHSPGNTSLIDAGALLRNEDDGFVVENLANPKTILNAVPTLRRVIKENIGKIKIDKEGPRAKKLSVAPDKKVTDSPNFKKWFKGSKVVDEKGEPLVVYHGTPTGGFTKFDKSLAGSGPITGHPIAKHGFWFAPNESMAKVYSGKDGEIIPTYLSAKKLYKMDMFGKESIGFANEKGIAIAEKVDPFVEKIKSQGYDGIQMTMSGDTQEYMVFSPTQIKSATGNRGTFSPTDPDIRFSVAPEPAPTFHSKLTKTIQDSKQSKAPASQWKAMIDKAGIKGEELANSEIKAWLDAQEGPVTKEDLVLELQSREVQLDEVEKGRGGKYPLTDKEMSRREELDKKRLSGELTVEEKRELGKYEYRIEKSWVGRETKFSEYQLPGGKDYKELLLTMPETKESYKSQHFDEPNVLAHVRFNSRTTEDGEKVLFLEEVQSDWHQEGRKKGYTKDVKKSVPQSYDKIKEMFPDETEILERGGLTPDVSPDGIELGFITGDGDVVTLSDIDSSPEYNNEMSDAAQRIGNAFYGGQEGGAKLPDAPFKKTWPDLVLKRMIRYAAENRFDRVAWTTGEQQAERYDLSKKVTDIAYRKIADEYQLSIREINAPFGKYKQLGTFPQEKLSGVVGKELADKIVSNKGEPGSNPRHGEYNWRTFEGKELSIGGEGMKTFYNKMLPNIAGKLVKKGGAKVETVELPEIGEQPSFPITEGLEDQALYAGFPMFSVAPQKTKVSESVYEANRKTAGKKITPSVAKKVGKGLEKVFTPISTRLKNMDQTLYNAMRRHEFVVLNRTKRDLKAVTPFLEMKKKKMSKDDYIDFDLAEKNSDMDKINELVTKYGLQKEYQAKRDVLERLYKEAVKAGFEVNHRDNFAPRHVKNVEGLLNYFRGTDHWSKIQKAINEETKKVNEKNADEGKPQRNLTTPEIVAIVDKFLRGYQHGKVTLSKPGQLKERKVYLINAKTNQFYSDSDAALTLYIDRINSAISARKFFGKSTVMTETGGIDIDETIGQHTALLVAQGKINYQQEQELQEILRARFNPGRTGELVSLFKNLEYIDTMGSPISALTQIGDFGFAVYNAGLLNTVAATFGKNKINVADIGIDKIAQEFSEASRSARALNATFKATGLAAMDRIGKNALINGEYRKIRAMAKKSPSKLLAELKPVFEGEAASVVKDIQAGKMTGNVKLHLFNKLLDFQPVALSEMPEMYLKSGNGKVFYMLKSYTIRQFDTYRRETITEFNKGNKKKAMLNMAKLTGAIVAANGTADLIKNFLLGRYRDIDDLIGQWDDLVIDNILRIAGFSKFMLWRFREGEVGHAIASLVWPPLKAVNSAALDLRNLWMGKDEKLEITSSIPLVGKLYYWWFGRGSDKVEKRREKKKWEKYYDLRKHKNKVDKLIDKTKKEKDRAKKLEYRRKVVQYRKEHSKELSYLKQAEQLKRRYNKYYKAADKATTTKEQILLEKKMDRIQHKFLVEMDKLGL